MGSGFVGQFFTGGGTSIGPITIPGGGLSIVVGVLWTLLWAVYYVVHGRRVYTHGAWWQVKEAELVRESYDAAETARTHDPDGSNTPLEGGRGEEGAHGQREP